MRMMRRLDPDAALRVGVRPARGEDIADSRAREKLKTDCVCGALIGVVRQRSEEPTQLLVGKPAFPAFLVVSLDALDRIVAAPPPFHSQRKHLGNQGKHAVRLVGVFLHGDVQCMDIAHLDGIDFLAAESRQDDAVKH